LSQYKILFTLGKLAFWILLEQEMMGWLWHRLEHMKVICTLLQRDNHASTSPLSFYRPDALPVAEPMRQSTDSTVLA